MKFAYLVFIKDSGSLRGTNNLLVADGWANDDGAVVIDTDTGIVLRPAGILDIPIQPL